MTPSQIYNDNELNRQRTQLLPQAIKLKSFWSKELKKVCRKLDKYKPLKTPKKQCQN